MHWKELDQVRRKLKGTNLWLNTYSYVNADAWGNLEKFLDEKADYIRNKLVPIPMWTRMEFSFGRVSGWESRLFFDDILDDKSEYSLDRNHRYKIVPIPMWKRMRRKDFWKSRSAKSQKYVWDNWDRKTVIVDHLFLRRFEMTKQTNFFGSKDFSTYSYVDKSKVCPEKLTGKRTIPTSTDDRPMRDLATWF